jgi:cell division protein FtsZ
VEAAQRAIASPLLDDGSIQGARGVLINITGSQDLTLHEVQEACSLVQKIAHEDANIIFGAVQDRAVKDAVKITVIATGFREVKKGATLVPAVAGHPGLSRVVSLGRKPVIPAVVTPPAAPANLDTPAFLRRRLGAY